MQIPFTFANQAGPIPLDQLDQNFAAIVAALNAYQVPAFVPTVAGTPNAITLTPLTPITAYVRGQTYIFIPTANNTGAVTIATSGLAPRALKYADGTALTGGELLTNAPYLIEDNGTNYVLMNSAQANGIISWTPVITFGGGNTGITYALQSGFATKIGRIVFHAFAVQLSNKGSSTGQALIGGLPYTVNAGWGGQNAGVCFSSNLTYGSGYNGFGYTLGGTTMTILNSPSGGAFTVLTNSAFGNTTLVAGSGFYST